MTRQTNGPMFLLRIALVGATLLVGNSFSNSAQQPTSTRPKLPKCDEIDISSGGVLPPCVLSKDKYEEITWENKTGAGPLYVCADPTYDSTASHSRDPFYAYAWLVRVNDFAKSGLVRSDIPKSDYQYTFYSSSNPCTVPPSHDEGTRSTPKVIIQ
jgi:hypothetical protein